MQPFHIIFGKVIATNTSADLQIQAQTRKYKPDVQMQTKTCKCKPTLANINQNLQIQCRTCKYKPGPGSVSACFARAWGGQGRRRWKLGWARAQDFGKSWSGESTHFYFTVFLLMTLAPDRLAPFGFGLKHELILPVWDSRPTP